MAFHFGLAESFNKTVGDLKGSKINPDDFENKTQFMYSLIHAVDIGTSVMEWDLFDAWGARVVQEF